MFAQHSALVSRVKTNETSRAETRQTSRGVSEFTRESPRCFQIISRVDHVISPQSSRKICAENFWDSRVMHDFSKIRGDCTVYRDTVRMTTFLFSRPRNYSILWLASVNLGCMSLKFGSLLGILYDQYIEIGRKPSQEYRNMKSESLSIVLPDDRVEKITRPCPFCTRKYEQTSGFFGLCIREVNDLTLYSIY